MEWALLLLLVSMAVALKYLSFKPAERSVSTSKVFEPQKNKRITPDPYEITDEFYSSSDLSGIQGDKVASNGALDSSSADRSVTAETVSLDPEKKDDGKHEIECDFKRAKHPFFEAHGIDDIRADRLMSTLTANDEDAKKLIDGKMGYPFEYSDGTLSAGRGGRFQYIESVDSIWISCDRSVCGFFDTSYDDDEYEATIEFLGFEEEEAKAAGWDGSERRESERKTCFLKEPFYMKGYYKLEIYDHHESGYSTWINNMTAINKTGNDMDTDALISAKTDTADSSSIKKENEISKEEQDWLESWKKKLMDLAGELASEADQTPHLWDEKEDDEHIWGYTVNSCPIGAFHDETYWDNASVSMSYRAKPIDASFQPLGMDDRFRTEYKLDSLFAGSEYSLSAFCKKTEQYSWEYKKITIISVKLENPYYTMRPIWITIKHDVGSC